MKIVAVMVLVVLVFFGCLQTFDDIRAWRHNRRQRKAAEARKALRDAYFHAMGEYARAYERGELRVKVESWIITDKGIQVVTPDRPADPYTVLVRREIEKLIRGQE